MFVIEHAAVLIRATANKHAAGHPATMGKGDPVTHIRQAAFGLFVAKTIFIRAPTYKVCTQFVCSLECGSVDVRHPQRGAFPPTHTCPAHPKGRRSPRRRPFPFRDPEGWGFQKERGRCITGPEFGAVILSPARAKRRASKKDEVADA
jgi:hypothetical protein